MGKNKVMIVEDDAALNEMLRFMLERNGYKTLQAEDTIQADQRLAQSIPGNPVTSILALLSLTTSSYAARTISPSIANQAKAATSQSLFPRKGSGSLNARWNCC